MVFSKDFKGQVKISEVKECLDALVAGVNKQIDLYNTSDYVQDIDYNIGAPDLAPLNYTLSVGGLKKFLNAYNGCVVGCKAFNIGGQYAVTDGIMFLQDGCHRIPAQVIPSLPKTLEYSPSAKIYKGQKEPPILSSGGIEYADTYPYRTNLFFTPDTYGFIGPDGKLGAITLTKKQRVNSIDPIYHPNVTKEVIVGEDICSSTLDPDWSIGAFRANLEKPPGSKIQVKWGDPTQSLSKLEFKVYSPADAIGGVEDRGNIEVEIPLSIYVDRQPVPLSNAWGSQHLNMRIVVKAESGIHYDLNPYVDFNGFDKYVILSYDYPSDAYYGDISMNCSIAPDAENILKIKFNDVYINTKSDSGRGYGFHVELYPKWCNTEAPLTVYPKIEATAYNEDYIVNTSVVVKPIYTGQLPCGTIYVQPDEYFSSSSVVTSGGGDVPPGITDWIYICDLNPNREIALSNTPNLAVCNVEGMYITSQTKNVGLETIEQRDINKAQFISGVPRDAKGAKGRGSRSNIVKLLGEYVARSFQNKKRAAGGIAIYNKLFLPKGVPNPYTYEGNGRYGPNGQKTFDANVTRNS